MHLRIEPGSKAYRLYNPTTRRIIVIRDVVFSENTSWNWKGDDGGSPGMFQMTWGDPTDEGLGPYNAGNPQDSEEDFNTSEPV